MKSIAEQTATGAIDETVAAGPRFPKGFLRNLAIDMGLPWAAIQLLHGAMGFPNTTAVAAAAAFPAASVLVNWVRRRRIDFIGVAVMVALIGGVLLVLATQDIRFVVLKPVVGATIFGLACLLTLRRRAPLMFYFVRQTAAGDDPDKIALWTGRLEIPGFRRGMRLLTLVWGVAFLAKAALWTGVVLLLPPTVSLLAAPVIGIGMFAALMAWTLAYERRGVARLAAAGL